MHVWWSDLKSANQILDYQCISFHSRLSDKHVKPPNIDKAKLNPKLSYIVKYKIWWMTENSGLCVYLLSGDVCICPWGRSPLRLAIGGDVQEVPYKDRVVMGTANNLELIKLQSEHTSRMLLQEVTMTTH